MDMPANTSAMEAALRAVGTLALLAGLVWTLIALTRYTAARRRGETEGFDLVCPYCPRAPLTRVHRRSWERWLCTAVYTCERCGRRFRHIL